MWIRDVNNYLAVTPDGKIKSKGAYWYPSKPEDYEGNWNKDFSMMCVSKVIEQHLIHGYPIEDLVKIVSNPFDFMLRYKTPAGASVFIGNKEMLKTVRYYVSTCGETMKKVAKPKGIIGQFKRKNKLSDSEFEKVMKEIGQDKWDDRIHTKNKSKYALAETNIENNWLVKECNIASNFNWKDLNLSYYIAEIEKLRV